MKNLIYVICIIIIFLVILLAIFSSYISLNTLAIIISLIAFILTPTLLILTIISISKGNNKKIKKEKILIKNENTDKFNKIYDKLYESHIKSLEELRKKAKREEIIKIVLLLSGFICCLVGEGYKSLGIVLIGFILLLISIYSFICLRSKRKYKEKYKKEIISSFVKLVNNNLKYKLLEEEGDFLQREFIKSKIETHCFNRYNCTDYIEGKLTDNVFIKMVDIDVKNVTGSGRSRNVEQIFEGIFAVAKGNKNINGYVKISRNNFIKNKKLSINMDSEEFEKSFDVLSENKILAMQILTADVMESLISFKNKYDIDFEIVLMNNKIYLRFFVSNMFEPQIFGNSMDKELIYTYYIILDFVVEITEKINKVINDVNL